MYIIIHILYVHSMCIKTKLIVFYVYLGNKNWIKCYRDIYASDTFVAAFPFLPSPSSYST